MVQLRVICELCATEAVNAMPYNAAEAANAMQCCMHGKFIREQTGCACSGVRSRTGGFHVHGASFANRRVLHAGYRRCVNVQVRHICDNFPRQEAS